MESQRPTVALCIQPWLKLAVAIWISFLSGGSVPKAAAQSPLENAIEQIRKSGEPTALIGVLTGAAYQALQAGDTDKAVAYVDEALQLARKTGQVDQVRSPLMIATQVLAKLDGDAPQQFLIRLLKQERGNAEIEMEILKTLGDQLLMAGDLVFAIQVFHDYADTAVEQAPESESAAWALLNYGRACINGRLFDLGIPALNQCKALATKLELFDVVAQADAALGNACLRTREFEIAINLFMKQLESAKKSHDRNSAFAAIGGLAMAFIGMGDVENADKLLVNNVKDASGINRGQLIGYQAVLCLMQDDAQHAIELMRQAIEAKESALPSSLIPGIGNAGLAEMTTMMDHSALAGYALRAGDLKVARDAIAKAQQGFAAMRRQVERAASFGATNLDASLTSISHVELSLSEFRQRILVQEGRIEEALVESEKGRGQSQLQLMEQRFGAGADAQPQPISIERIKQIASETDTTLVQYSVIHTVDFATRSLLGPEHSLSRAQALYVWLVTPEGQVHFAEIPLAGKLEALAQAVRLEVDPPRVPTSEEPAPQASSNEDAELEETGSQGTGTNGTENKSDDATQPTDRSGTNSAAESGSGGDEDGDEGGETKTTPSHLTLMYQLVIDPITEYLPQHEDAEVLIVPQGELFAIPFIALTDPNGTPLIASHTISLAPSIETFALSAQRHAATLGNIELKNVLVVGNPDMPMHRQRPDLPPAPLDPLPGSEWEAKAIASMLGIDPLIGTQADESSVRERMQDAPIIHLASHGLLESDNVFTQSYLSSIALAPSDDDNGFLTVREVMDMRLNANLAVLSACDSGRGKITGDGVVGLSRGYLTAGVPSVVVSLWPVSDAATAELMVAFYRALAEGRGKANALRTAILATREKYPDPNLWAPFCLYGYGG